MHFTAATFTRTLMLSLSAAVLFAAAQIYAQSCPPAAPRSPSVHLLALPPSGETLRYGGKGTSVDPNVRFGNTESTVESSRAFQFLDATTRIFIGIAKDLSAGTSMGGGDTRAINQVMRELTKQPPAYTELAEGPPDPVKN